MDSVVPACQDCGKVDSSVRSVQFFLGGRVAEGIHCRRHRLVRGWAYAPLGLSWTFLLIAGLMLRRSTRRNSAPGSAWGNLWNNLTGGWSVPGTNIDLLEQIANHLNHQGKSVEAANALKVAQKYREQMDRDLQAAERAARVAESSDHFRGP